MRGDIFRLRGSKAAKGHEQKGRRLAVVVQADHFPLSTVLAAPTSTSCLPLSFRPVIDVNGTPTRVMVDQLAVVDPEVRFADKAGRVTLAEMQAIETAMRDILDLG
ncbi:MAG: type II toxin-antitoxin system PemK/MazF family toxin [Micrococcales bacterium]|nr:type II toxin-antitoxin system PemK/MazF family toxin [Micrococcales bacterium]